MSYDHPTFVLFYRLAIESIYLSFQACIQSNVLFFSRKPETDWILALYIRQTARIHSARLKTEYIYSYSQTTVSRTFAIFLIFSLSMAPCSGSAYTVDSHQYFRKSDQEIAISLYLSKTDWSFTNTLLFKRIYNSANSSRDTGWGPGWQTNFDTRILIASNELIKLLTPDGQIAYFHKAKPEIDSGSNSNSNPANRWLSNEKGYIERGVSATSFIWHTPDGLTYRYKGPYPITITDRAGDYLSLHYRSGSLRSIKHPLSGQQLSLLRSLQSTTQSGESKIERIRLPDESTLTLSDAKQLDEASVDPTISTPITGERHTATVKEPRVKELISHQVDITTASSRTALTYQTVNTGINANQSLLSNQYSSSHPSSNLLTQLSILDSQTGLTREYAFKYDQLGSLTSSKVTEDGKTVYHVIPDKEIDESNFSCIAVLPEPEVAPSPIENQNPASINTGENSETNESECTSSENRDSSAQSLNRPTSQPSGFSIPGSLSLDLRPEECNSYFDFRSPIARGSAIEDAIALHDRYATATPTVQWFPSIDFTLDNTAIVQVSRDLTSATYTNNPDILFRLLLQEADNLRENFIEPLETEGFVTANESAESTTIHRSDIDGYRIELIVQSGRMTALQATAIARAAQDLRDNHGITLQVIEIP